MKSEEQQQPEVEIEETMGLKSADNFEELNLNPDLLRGIYGTLFLIQLSVSRSHPSSNRGEFSRSSVRRTLLPKPSPELARPLPSLLAFSSSLTPSLPIARPLFLLLPGNLPSKSIRLFSASVSS